MKIHYLLWALLIFLFSITLVNASDKLDLINDHLTMEPSELDAEYVLSYSIAEDSKKLKVEKVKEKTINVSEFKNKKFDLKLSVNGSTIEFKNLTDIFSTKNIKFTEKKGIYTDIVSIDEINLDHAVIVLRKKNDSYASAIMHSYNGVNYTRTKTPFEQNTTHVWFNATHFSSYFATFSDVEILIDGAPEIIDITTYATIDAGHYIDIDYPCGASTCDVNNKGLSSGFRCEIASDLASDNSFQVCISYDHSMILDALAGYVPIEDTIFVNIRTAADALEDTEPIDVTVSEFEFPSSTIDYVPQSTSQTSAVLRGQVDFNDFSGTVEARIEYREYGSGDPWSQAEAYESVSDGVIFTQTASGLTADTLYENRVWFKFTYDSILRFDSSDYVGLFTTEAPEDPDVTTYSAIGVTDQVATLRAVTDFGDFSGAVAGRFTYNIVGNATTTTTDYQGVSDGVIFSKALSGLTPDTFYEYFAQVTWNDSGTNFDTGAVVPFNTFQVGSSNLTNDNIFYWPFDTGYVDITQSYKPLDQSPNLINGTNNGAYWVNESAAFYEDINGSFSFLTNDYIDLDSLFWSTVSSDTEGTFNFWWRMDNKDDAVVFSIADASTTERFEVKMSSSLLTVGMALVGDNRWFTDLKYDIFDTLKYYMITIVKDSTNTTIYVNATIPQQGYFVSDHITDWFSVLSTGLIDSVSMGARRYNGAGLGQYLDGDLDEFSYWDRALSQAEIAELYNAGNGYNFYYDVGVDTPEVTTLEETNLTSSSVVLRGIADFGDFNGSVYGTFQLKLNSSSNWTSFGNVTDPILNDTVFYWTINNLTSNTIYDYQAVLTWYDGESLNDYGNWIQFTSSKIRSNLDNVTAFNVTDTSAEVGFNLTLNDMSAINYSVSYFDWSDYLSGTFVVNDIDIVQNYSDEGFKSYNISFLQPTNAYGFIVTYQDEQGLRVTTPVSFTPGLENLPAMTPTLVDRITRDSARIRYTVSGMGNYTAFQLDFLVSEFNASSYLINKSVVHTGVGNYTMTLDNLEANTTYDVIFQFSYTGGGYNSSIYGGLFTTKAVGEFVDPWIDMNPAIATNGGVNLSADVTLNDATNTFIQFFINGTLNSSHNFLATNSQSINTSGNYSVQITGLDENLLWARSALIYFNTTTTLTLYSDYVTFTPDETIIQPKYVTVVGDWRIYVSDPYLFSLMIICGIAIFGLGLSVGASMLRAENGVNRLLLVGVTFMSIFALIWLSLNGLIPLWQLIISIVGSVVLGVYFLLKGNGAGVGVYG